jgi:hypothetical protein
MDLGSVEEAFGKNPVVPVLIGSNDLQISYYVYHYFINHFNVYTVTVNKCDNHMM